MVKVGINGFGRIGRNVLRAALDNPDIQIVAINDLTDSKTLAHLLKYDSLLGKLDAEVTASEGGLVIDGKPITVFSERNPASIPWRQREVDIVIEATGLFTDREKAAVHIHSGGAKRVIISAPGKNDDLTIVMGVNESLYSPDKHYVISNGSCTTNGLAPAAQVLHQHFGIKHGLMNTTHAYTNSQALHDQPEKDLRGARAAALSIVPYSSGAAKALGKVIPELDGRLTGYSLRVPVPVVSIVDLTVTLERDDTRERAVAIEPVNMEAGCVGRRCYLSSVHHSTSAGASVYGHDWNSPFECVNDAGAFLRITSVADKGLVDTQEKRL